MHTSAEEEEGEEEEAVTRLERCRLRGHLYSPPSSGAPGGPSDFSAPLTKVTRTHSGLNAVKSVAQRLKAFSFNDVHLLSSWKRIPTSAAVAGQRLYADMGGGVDVIQKLFLPDRQADGWK